MSNRRHFVIVELRWLPLGPGMKYPSDRWFGATGYRENDGPTGLFSVYVKLGEGVPGPGAVQQARLYALADHMRDRLPEIGARFILTSGATEAAECIASERGEEEE